MDPKEGLIYKEETKAFTIGKNFKCLLKKEMFPKDILILNIENPDTQIRKGIMTNTIEEIYFCDKHSIKIDSGSFPSSLRKLVLGNDYNNYFQQMTFPKKLKELHLGKKYEKELMYLPENLEILKIQNVKTIINKNTIPAKLKKLILDSNNAPTQKNISFIPNTVEHLELFKKGECLAIYDLSFLCELSILKLNYKDYKNIVKLPENIKYLEIYNNLGDYKFIRTGILPNKIEYLVLHSLSLFPKDIYYENDEIIYTQEIMEEFNEKLKNLKYLSLSGVNEEDFILNNLPSNLETIKFSNLKIAINKLPTSLKKIIIDDQNKKYLITCIPPECEIATVDDDIFINDCI
jgi:hypothetical protein